MAKRSSRHIDGVLVVGGGYAGLHAAKAAADAGADVTLLDSTGRHDFVTRLAAVAGGTAPLRDASRELATFDRVVEVGTATALADGRVDLADGNQLTSDAVVFCAGAETSQPAIGGIEHALPLRTSDDAVALHEQLAGDRPVTIIGGGATGVQLAGAISASRAAPVVRVAETAPRLLASMHPETSEGAMRILRDRGVELLLDATVEQITADAVVVDGEELEGLCVWAGGFIPRTSGLDVELNDQGQIVVDEHLRVHGMERTFAAGDVAAHRAKDGSALPMSAQVAVQAGEAAGANAACVVRGRDLKPAMLNHQGWVLDLSGQRGVAEFGDHSLAGPFADLIPPFLHGVIDLRTLFGIGGLSTFRR